MSNDSFKVGNTLSLDRKDFERIFAALSEQGYKVLGPSVRDDAIVYGQIEDTEALPAGITDELEAATYRLTKRDDDALFGYNMPPQSFKRFLYPPKCTLMRASRKKHTFEVTVDENSVEKQAFLGVRPCEFRAIAIQDRIFMQGEFYDDDYRRRRDNTLTVAVNCTEAGRTCFCSSMGTGPRAIEGFDLCLTELIDDKNHRFLVEIGSEAGLEIAARLGCGRADDSEIELAGQRIEHAAANMGRSIDTDGLPELLTRNLDNVYWEVLGKRCMSCTNCTMVCPTCFCGTVEDTTDLTGDTAERTRRWDSCFTADFSYIHGGSVRPSTKARYRQWLTHKLGNWHEQFGTEGCVGCGRCIVWCPVGIDITESARVIRERDVRPTEEIEKTEIQNENS